jgi:hypothetical protein
MTTTLKIGQAYDVASLRCMGWTDGDGSGYEGYDYATYFDGSGRYLGPDAHGIEPICETTKTPYRYATDATMGTIEAESLESAMDQVRPTEAQIADGGWAWVEAPDGERLDTRD